MITSLNPSLNQYTEYKNILISALEKAVESKHTLIFERKYQSAWIETSKEYFYLFYRSGNVLTVCEEKKYNRTKDIDNAFSYHRTQMEDKENFAPNIMFLPNKVLQICLNKFNIGKEETFSFNVNPEFRKIEEEYQQKNNHTPDEETEYKALFRGMMLDSMYSYGTIVEPPFSKKDLIEFNQHLFNQGYLEKEVEKEKIEKLGEMMAKNSYIIDSIDELLPNLEELVEKVKLSKYTSKNKLSYNDGDYALWKSSLENAMCIRNQEITFLIINNAKSDWSIYHFSHENAAYKSEKLIIKAIENNVCPLVETVLLIRKGNPTYIGDYIDCMSQDIEYGLEELKTIEIEENEVNKTN